MFIGIRTTSLLDTPALYLTNSTERRVHSRQLLLHLKPKKCSSIDPSIAAVACALLPGGMPRAASGEARLSVSPRAGFFDDLFTVGKDDAAKEAAFQAQQEILARRRNPAKSAAYIENVEGRRRKGALQRLHSPQLIGFCTLRRHPACRDQNRRNSVKISPGSGTRARPQSRASRGY